MFSLDIAKKKRPAGPNFSKIRFPDTLKNCMGIKCLIRRKLRCWHPSHVTWSRDWNEKKLLCDTSFALARSSSTRRYTGKSMVLLGSDCKMKPLIRRQCPWYFGSVLVDFRDIDRLVGIDRIHTTVSLTSRVSACDIPRPAGVWIVTRPRWGGGGQRPPPPEISQTTGPIFKFQTPFDSPVRDLPVEGQKFDPEVTDDVTGQVKVRILDFLGLVTSASKISILSANKAK